MKRTKIINLYGGPGTGKSTTAAGLFSYLKQQGVNCEYVQEYAKDKAWEFGNSHKEENKNPPKVFLAQEYIFAKQHFRIRRCAEDVDIIVTDSPLLLGLVYMPEDFELPSLRNTIREAYSLYESIDIFLIREKAYNPKGRMQTEDEAKELDNVVRTMLNNEHIEHFVVNSDLNAVAEIAKILTNEGWI
jgi:hypothetical protein